MFYNFLVLKMIPPWHTSTYHFISPFFIILAKFVPNMAKIYSVAFLSSFITLFINNPYLVRKIKTIIFTVISSKNINKS